MTTARSRVKYSVTSTGDTSDATVRGQSQEVAEAASQLSSGNVEPETDLYPVFPGPQPLCPPSTWKHAFTSGAWNCLKCLPAACEHATQSSANLARVKRSKSAFASSCHRHGLLRGRNGLSIASKILGAAMSATSCRSGIGMQDARLVVASLTNHDDPLFPPSPMMLPAGSHQ